MLNVTCPPLLAELGLELLLEQAAMAAAPRTATTPNPIVLR
jgi:hypothetical protein